MVKYNFAVGVLMSLATVEGFGPHVWTISSFQRVPVSSQRRHVSAPTFFDPSFDDNNENTRGKGNVSASSVDSLFDSDAAEEEEDAYEEELARKELKKKIIKERSGNYEVSLPLDREGGLGVSLCEVNAGEFSDADLNLDTLRLQSTPGECESTAEALAAGSLQTMDQSTMAKRLGPDFRGVIVSSVVKDSKGWNSGIRPGDVLVATSATLGKALWPKSTLEGVRSAIASRKNLANSMTFEFQHVDMAELTEKYELTLPRPFGLKLEETEDGYVQVSGFTEKAPRLVKYAVQVGDRILAVDSIAGNMWQVSTVEGIISACTSRLPGQPVTFRFARRYADEATRKKQTEISSTAVDEAVAPPKEGAALSVTDVSSRQTSTRTATLSSQDALLSRCRTVLRRYMAEAETKLKDKYAVPAIVADRVVEALASSSASVDGETLSLIMSAYLSCRKPEKAIRVFEAAVGLKGDGSSSPRTIVIECKKKDGSSIVANTAALNLYTGTSLLRAHALTGNLSSVRRILSALEGRGGATVDGVEVAMWPGTGDRGSIVPDTTCYNTALGAAAKAGGKEGIHMALELFESMADPGAQGNKTEKDLVSYNTVIGALSKAGLWRDAFAVFDSMNLAKVKPDKFTYTSLVNACIYDGDIQELVIDMKQRGVQPDVVTYNTMIKALCDRYKWFEAQKLITDMEQRGITPNSMTYGLLMNGLLKANKPAACLTLFETACSDVRTTAVTENVHLYTTAIAATSALGDHERALELVSRMNAAGVKPNLKTLTALMGACLSSGKADIAAEVYRKIENPDSYARKIGIRAYCAAGDFISASEILSEHCKGYGGMSGKDIMSSYNVLISSALEQNDYDMARKTFTELLKSGYIPSKEMYQKIIDALKLGPRKRNVIQEPAVDEAFDFLAFVLDSVEKRNLACDGSFYASILYCGARLGGLRRKVASLMAESRALTDEASQAIALTPEQGGDVKQSISWEDLIQNYDVYKEQIGSEIQLPPLGVRVGNRNIRQVLAAEQAVTYNSVRKSSRKPRFATDNLAS